MSSNDKQGDVSVQRKEDSLSEKEKGQNDVKSDSSPQKRSAAELNSTDEVKQKVQKTDHKNEKENGESEEKFEDGEDDDDVVPDDYDEGEDGEGDGDEDGADEDDDEEEEA